MKKVWGILLSMILIIGLTACGNTDTAQEEASAPAAENTSAATSAAEEESVSATEAVSENYTIGEIYHESSLPQDHHRRQLEDE